MFRGLLDLDGWCLAQRNVNNDAGTSWERMDTGLTEQRKRVW